MAEPVTAHTVDPLGHTPPAVFLLRAPAIGAFLTDTYRQVMRGEEHIAVPGPEFFQGGDR